MNDGRCRRCQSVTIAKTKARTIAVQMDNRQAGLATSPLGDFNVGKPDIKARD